MSWRKVQAYLLTIHSGSALRQTLNRGFVYVLLGMTLPAFWFLPVQAWLGRWSVVAMTTAVLVVMALSFVLNRRGSAAGVIILSVMLIGATHFFTNIERDVQIFPRNNGGVLLLLPMLIASGFWSPKPAMGVFGVTMLGVFVRVALVEASLENKATYAVNTLSGLIVFAFVIALSASLLHTLLGDLEAQVAARTRDLEAANATIRTIMQNAAHDIGTPLQGILGLLELLMELFDDPTADESERSELLRRINGLVWRLVSISRTLVAGASLKDGRLPLHVTEVDVVAICTRAVDHLSPLIVRRDDSRCWVTCTLATPVIATDGAYLERIVENLLSNAAKSVAQCDRAALVEVRISTVDTDWIEIAVTDNGVGIDADTLAGLGTRVMRSVTSHTSNGVGLQLVAQIIHALGGTLSITSDGLDCGAVATVRLPRLRTESEHK